MQYVSFKIRPGDRWFHPVDGKIAEADGLRHGPVHNVNLLDDGTMAVLYEVHGERDRVEELLDTHRDSYRTETVAMGEDTLVYTHSDPSDDIRTLLEMVDERPILLDLPITFSDDDELEVTVVSYPEAIQAVFADAPAGVQLRVEKVGEYCPGPAGLFRDLTSRQQEILLTALEMGYYEDPRESTYDEIADAVGCTATTIGEHLRKIERHVLREIVTGNVRS